MNRRYVDAGFGVLVAAVLAVGAFLTWDAYQQQQSTDGMMGSSMMDSSMGTMQGTDPIWYFLGTILVAAVVAGFYFVVRDDLAGQDTDRTPDADQIQGADYPARTRPTREADQPGETDHAGGTDHSQPSEEQGAEQPPETADESETDTPDPAEQSPKQVLDLLPEDERRILTPVVDSPGLTQIELRDRSDFSKSKVSQTVSDLEKRGLLYRERQGRTYRVYPGEDLEQ
jgi:hypothetical protein